MYYSKASFTLRSKAAWEGGTESVQEGGEVRHALDYNQCVFGRRTLLQLCKAPAFNVTFRQLKNFSTRGLTQPFVEVRRVHFGTRVL